jgi:hypothetical protein
MNASTKPGRFNVNMRWNEVVEMLASEAERWPPKYRLTFAKNLADFAVNLGVDIRMSVMCVPNQDQPTH